MDERKIAIFFRRLYTMIIALVAPELMVTWAMMQFLSARDTAKTFNVAFNHSESKAILSAPHDNFRGRLPAQPFGAVANFVQRMSHRVDISAWVFRMDGRIHALHR
jgi:hypothetical protein